MDDSLFKRLTPQEEKAYRAWARANWQPGQYINPVWHPVVRDECERMTKEREQTRAFRDRMDAES